VCSCRRLAVALGAARSAYCQAASHTFCEVFQDASVIIAEWCGPRPLIEGFFQPTAWQTSLSSWERGRSVGVSHGQHTT